MPSIVMLPESWFQLQRRLSKEHPDFWKLLQQADIEQGLTLLNRYLGCFCTSAMTYDMAAETYLKALDKKTPSIIVPGDARWRM